MGKKKVPINIVFIGHVNSGKSTTAGHLIYKQGGIDKSAVERFEKEAAKPNKYAWVLDRLKSEHERGITIDIDMYKFETTEYYCTVIDAPGDKHSFLKTMISGTSQPDCVVLVIDSTTSGFETGLDRQARALVHLSFVFGVKNLICCCNKMDATIPKYSEKRFLDIVLKLMPFLWMVGYNQDETLFIPISALDGDNLTQSSTNIPWYKGLTLLEALHQVNDPKKRISRRPLIKAGRNTAWENGITLRTVWENALDVGANIQSNCSDLEPRKKMRTDSESHLDEKQVSSIVEKIKQVIMASSTRDDDDEDEVFDDDDEEIKLLKEKNKQEVELFDNVGDCLGTLIKMFKASFLSFFEEISSYLTPMFGKNKTSEERRIAVRIFCDIAEHCREAAHKYYGSFLPFLLEACNDECSDVRQVAVNGIDVCAQFGGSVFEPFVEEALSTLSKLIDAITVDSDNVMECENAHSVFNKIRNLHD